jgi:UDP-3-O-acyl-N-acetylglucosamine deacetylase
MLNDENDIMNDPACSHWLKRQLQETKERDILDALADVEILSDVLKKRFEAMTGGHGSASHVLQ